MVPQLVKGLQVDSAIWRAEAIRPIVLFARDFQDHFHVIKQ